MKHSLRRLLKSPAFALTALITVGAAIGANALIFSVVNGVILKPLPYAEPSRLVGAWLVAPGVMPGPLQQSAATYFMIRDSAQSFQDIGLWNSGSATVTGRGEPEQVETLERHRRHAADPRRSTGARPRLQQGRRPAEWSEGRAGVSSVLAARVRRQCGGDRSEPDGEWHRTRGDRRAARRLQVPARQPARDRCR